MLSSIVVLALPLLASAASITNQSPRALTPRHHPGPGRGNVARHVGDEHRAAARHVANSPHVIDADTLAKRTPTKFRFLSRRAAEEEDCSDDGSGDDSDDDGSGDDDCSGEGDGSSSSSPTTSSAAPKTTSSGSSGNSSGSGSSGGNGSSSGGGSSGGSSSSGSSGSDSIVGQTFSGGMATWFTQDGGQGACGEWKQDSFFLVALQTQKYGDGSDCKKVVKVTNTDTKKSVIAMVLDECPTCQGNANSLDLSLASFDAIGDEATGMLPITWGFVDPSTPLGPVSS